MIKKINAIASEKQNPISADNAMTLSKVPSTVSTTVSVRIPIKSTKVTKSEGKVLIAKKKIAPDEIFSPEEIDIHHRAKHISPYDTYTPNFIQEVQTLDLEGGIAVDCETTGLSIYEGDAPFSISFCDRAGKSAYVEWPVNPFTREVTYLQEQVDVIRLILENPRISNIYHHAKFDVRMIKRWLGVSTLGRIEDTLFAARICNTLEFSYGLKPLASKYADIPEDDIHQLKEPLERARRLGKKFGYNLAESKEADYWLLRHLLTVAPHESIPLIGENAYIYCENYCRLDTFRTMRLWQLYEAIMEKDKYHRGTYDRETRLYHVIYEMEDRGIRISKERNNEELQQAKEIVAENREIMVNMLTEDMVEKYEYRLTNMFMNKNDISREQTQYDYVMGFLPPEEMEVVDKKNKRRRDKGQITLMPRSPELSEQEKEMIRNMVQANFNPGSNKQLLSILFDLYALEVKVRTDKGTPSTNWEALKDHLGHPFVRALMLYRASDKAVGTFFEKYANMMKADPLSPGEYCLHPGLNQLGTVTGRFSCIRKGTPITICRDNEAGYENIPIEKVVPGDIALCYSANGSNKMVARPVLGAWHRGQQKVMRLNWQRRAELGMISGHVDMTYGHPVRIGGNYIPARSLYEERKVLGFTGQYEDFLANREFVYVASKEYIDEVDDVYDLHIQDTENYIAGGVCVKNCIRKGTPIEIVRDVSKYPEGIPIEDVKVGDLAYTFDGQGKLTLRKVLNVYDNGEHEVIRIHWRTSRTKIEGYLDLTSDHLVHTTTQGYVKAEDLKKGTSVYALQRYNPTKPEHNYSMIRATGKRGDPGEHVQFADADHRFICEVLYNQRSNYKLQVHHKDENKLNNNVDNLQLITPKEHYSEHAKTYTEQDRENKRKGALAGADSRRKQGISNKGREYKKLDREQLISSLQKNKGDLKLVASEMGVEKRSIQRRMEWYGIGPDGTLVNNHVILGIERIGIIDRVYDLEIEETHNYIANQINTHNCSAPNLQQVSSASSNQKGTAITARAPFGPRKDHVLLAYDYAQQEARIFAACAKIQTMIDWVLSGRDLNTENANKAWGGKGNPAGPISMAQSLELGRDRPSTPELAKAWAELQWTAEDSKGGTRSSSALSAAREWLEKYDYNIVEAEKVVGKKSTRSRAKVVLFAKIYGGGPSSVQGLLYCSPEEAKEYMDTYDKALPEIRVYMDKMIRKAEKDGFIINKYGRKLNIDPNYGYRATNYMIQSSAADMMKEAIYKVSKYFKSIGKRAYVLLTIHDELMMEVHKDDLTHELFRDIKHVMEDHEGRFEIPMEVEGSIAWESWADKETLDIGEFETKTKKGAKWLAELQIA